LLYKDPCSKAGVKNPTTQGQKVQWLTSVRTIYRFGTRSPRNGFIPSYPALPYKWCRLYFTFIGK